MKVGGDDSKSSGGLERETTRRAIRFYAAFLGLAQIGILAMWVIQDQSLALGPNVILFLAAAVSLPNGLCLIALPQLEDLREEIRNPLLGLVVVSVGALLAVDYSLISRGPLALGGLFALAAAASYYRGARSSGAQAPR